MGTHQGIVVALEVEVKGKPTYAGRGGSKILEAGTVGFIGDRVNPPYVLDSPIVYAFYPAGYSKTATAEKDNKSRLRPVVLAESVVLPAFSMFDDEEPVVSIPIHEAGYARISNVEIKSGVEMAATRCRLVYDSGQNIFAIERQTGRHPAHGTFVGRILSATRTEPLFSGIESQTCDVEFFRQRNVKAEASAESEK
jgi:hypothetical protein